MNHLDEAKLLSALLGVLKKESSKVRDGLLEELREQLQKDIEDQSGVKYLQLEDIDDLRNPIPIQVFKGDQGPKGNRGAKGAKGDVGPRGLRGAAGPRGATGDVGPIGPTGPQGVRGETGPQGPAGKDGVDGVTPDIKPVEDKLLTLLNDFKGSISAQVTRMAYAKGGGSSGSGEVKLLRLDDVDTTNLADGKFLRYNASTGNLEFVEGSGSVDLSSYDGHILPGANNTYDLGSPTRQWRDLYLSGSSLFINGVPAISQDPTTGNIVLAANTVITSANGQNNLVASQPNLDAYLEVANVASIVTSRLQPYLKVANSVNFATTSNLNNYLQVANSTNFATTTQLSTKANSADLAALATSGAYSDLIGTPNLDIFASNTALQTKANSSDLNQYLQVANNKTIVAGSNVSLSTNSTSIVINSTGGGGGGDLNDYMQVANTTSFVSTVLDHGSGQTLIKSKINNILTLNTLKAGPNITIEENSDGEIKISATGELSVSDSLDFGFVNNDFGSITDNAESDPQFDFGTI